MRYKGWGRRISGKTSECRFPYCGRGLILRVVEMPPSFRFCPFVSLQTRVSNTNTSKSTWLASSSSAIHPNLLSYLFYQLLPLVLPDYFTLYSSSQAPSAHTQGSICHPAILPEPTNCESSSSKTSNSSRDVVGYHPLDVPPNVQVGHSNSPATTTSSSQ
jgi:hypothetical protein